MKCNRTVSLKRHSSHNVTPTFMVISQQEKKHTHFGWDQRRQGTEWFLLGDWNGSFKAVLHFLRRGTRGHSGVLSLSLALYSQPSEKQPGDRHRLLQSMITGHSGPPSCGSFHLPVSFAWLIAPSSCLPDSLLPAAALSQL